MQRSLPDRVAVIDSTRSTGKASEVVRLEGVSASYAGERNATLNGLTLTVTAREQVAITGPNGAGKTTILEVINGLLPVDSGSVRVLGEAVGRTSHSLRARISYVPQNLFFPADTPYLVKDVVLAVRFGRGGLRPFASKRDREHARHGLEAVGMAGSARRPIGRLSGGQQRKTLIARAVAQEAELLLLDEPTANLDSEAKLEVAALVARIREDLDATAVVVSHEAGHLLDASDRYVVVESGGIVSKNQEGAAGSGSA